jgi:glycosyltransferase involved in cell wall biosynthesis
VILAAYGRPDLLARCLAAYTRQSHDRFEIVVADDGSPEAYDAVLAAYAPRFKEPIQHVRQEDRGFRKNRILNRAIAAARFPHLVFADFDCLPHPRFVQDHLDHLRRGEVLSGRRVHVADEAVPTEQAILERGLGLGPVRLLALALRGKARVIEHGLFLPVFYEAGQTSLFGSNLSAMREDLALVNGFNEEYEAAGTGEDTDLDLRLRRAGIVVRVFRNRMIQYHVAHPSPVYEDPRNLAILERTRASGDVRARRGLGEIQPGDSLRRVYGGEGTGGGTPPVPGT